MINSTDSELIGTDIAAGSKIEVIDTAYRVVGPADSAYYIEANFVDTDTNESIIDTADMSGSTESNNIFKINTSFAKIEERLLLKKKKSEINKEENTDLFSELLLSDGSDKTVVDQIFSENGVSYQDILKLIAIAGQDILIGDGW